MLDQKDLGANLKPLPLGKDESLNIVMNNCSELKYINEYNFTVGGLFTNQVIIMKTNKRKGRMKAFSFLK